MIVARQHVCGIDQNGFSYCWGNRGGGVLGIRSGSDVTPNLLDDVHDRSYKQIDVGYQTTCALTFSGEAWCWGFPQQGQLGHGSTFYDSLGPYPQAVIGGHQFQDIRVASNFVWGLSDGQTLCWGSNVVGQLGNGGSFQSTSPEPVRLPFADVRLKPNDLDLEGGLDPKPDMEKSASRAVETSQLRSDTSSLLESLRKTADSHGKAQVIVGLATGFANPSEKTRAQREQQRQLIQVLQSELLEDLQGHNFTEIARFKTIPYTALSVDGAALAALENHPGVISIEENSVSSPTMASSNPVIGSPIAWAGGFDGEDQAVAILDTGVDRDHTWFTNGGNKVVSEACYSTAIKDFSVSACPDGVETSTEFGSGVPCSASIASCDHGTHVAGIATGNDGNGPGFGVARGADLVAIQVFSEFTNESGCGAGNAPCSRSFKSDQIQAMERVLELTQTMDIAAINMSLGGSGYSNQDSCDAANPSIKAVIDNLRLAGVATVIAAGNDGFRNGMSQPGCISTAVSVGATNNVDVIASFSNIHPATSFLAPGVGITSSVPTGTGAKSGTSMAAPHVAGAWAVLKQQSPFASVEEVLSALTSTGTPVDDLRTSGTVLDLPRINIDQALSSLGGLQNVFAIFNDGFVDLEILSITPNLDAPWISVNPGPPFKLAPSEFVVVEIIIDWARVPAGVTELKLEVDSNDPDENPYPDGLNLSVRNLQIILKDGFE